MGKYGSLGVLSIKAPTNTSLGATQLGYFQGMALTKFHLVQYLVFY